ncbi:MAG: NTP transferase domain-containing protein [Desulfovibrio sp.]|nr:NTP transferase domain-containing protein [Desulfovibrio sp.]
MCKPVNTAALILAAGKAERMGRVKALLPLPFLPGGEDASSLAGLARLYRRCGVDHITVVSGFHAAAVEAEAAALGLTVVRNPSPEAGMFSSVQTGIYYISTFDRVEAVFVQPVDVPLVRPLTIMALLDSYREARTTDTAAVLVPQFDGQQGHPPLIPTCHASRICAHDGQGGLYGVLSGLPLRPVPVVDSNILADMDTPDDYTHLCRLAPWRTALRPAEAVTLLHLRHVSEKGLRHARAVGKVAAAFAASLGKTPQAGRVTTCRPWLAMSGGLLHDIAKGLPHHEQTGGALLDSLGLPDMARLVREHRDLTLSEQDPLTERELVYLADKYCRGDTFVPLERRFGMKMEQFSHDASACAAIASRLERAQRMEARLAKETKRSPAAMAHEALKEGSCASFFEVES